MSTRRVVIALSLALVAVAHAAPPTATPLVSMDELRATRNAGKYADVIAACQRIVALRDDASASAYPRHEVRMIYADALLHQKRSAQAVDLLKTEVIAAQKANAQPDADEANALAILIRASPNLAYTPTSGDDKKPIDIVAADTRKTALSRLFDDRVAACRALQTASAEAKTLAPLPKVVTAFADVRALDHVSDASPATADDLGKELTTWAGTLADQVLDHANAEVTRISKGSIVDDDGTEHTRATRHTALDSNQIGQLKSLSGDCEKLPGVVADLTKSFATPGATTKPSTVQEHAAKVVARIHQLLEDNDRLQEQRRNDNNNNGRGRRY